jgi:hypothetical protein
MSPETEAASVIPGTRIKRLIKLKLLPEPKISHGPRLPEQKYRRA